MHLTLHCSSQMTTSEFCQSHTPAEKGFKAVTFDMRGVGRSTGKASLTGFAEIKDVIAVCKLVSKNLSANRILLVGSSAVAEKVFMVFNVETFQEKDPVVSTHSLRP